MNETSVEVLIHDLNGTLVQYSQICKFPVVVIGLHQFIYIFKHIITSTENIYVHTLSSISKKDCFREKCTNQTYNFVHNNEIDFSLHLRVLNA